eukprot:TRINITY_DN60297_c0_g1_i2.p2 TRINITY_DN60297_c0_g1~~TRINITY_DN60297_c0_g1_i2.p2  ORF type:complete len:246 (-),score=34.70 TRINITY_DN60297_c0_g1_i2:981-1616(-)
MNAQILQSMSSMGGKGGNKGTSGKKSANKKGGGTFMLDGTQAHTAKNQPVIHDQDVEKFVAAHPYVDWGHADTPLTNVLQFGGSASALTQGVATLERVLLPLQRGGSAPAPSRPPGVFGGLQQQKPELGTAGVAGVVVSVNNCTVVNFGNLVKQFGDIAFAVRTNSFHVSCGGIQEALGLVNCLTREEPLHTATQRPPPPAAPCNKVTVAP